MSKKTEHWIGSKLASILSERSLQTLVAEVAERDPNIILQVFGPLLNRQPNMDNMCWDLPLEGTLRFEHLAGLFASTSLDHGVISMPVRQGAYLFGLTRQMQARKVIEIGRYKGGSTLLIAAAMGRNGEFWSIDIGKKEARMFGGQAGRSFDDMLTDVCERFDLKVDIVVGDSRTLELDTGEVDLVFIDGDHTYEGVRNDFERFGRRVRVGGAVLFDDVFDEGIFKTHVDTVGRLVQEIVAEGKFKLVKGVNRLAHLERISE